MSHLGPRLATALAAHPGLLKQAEAGWDEDVAWARAHGYDPAAPFYVSPDLVDGAAG